MADLAKIKVRDCELEYRYRDKLIRSFGKEVTLAEIDDLPQERLASVRGMGQLGMTKLFTLLEAKKREPDRFVAEYQVTKLEVYKTSDGSLFEDPDEAVAHEMCSGFKAWCRDAFSGVEHTSVEIAEKILATWNVVKK